VPARPPNPDELINRFAQNLGVSPDKVRAAITQVEGPNRLYFVVPGLG
jgi:transcription initiation factor TFIIIB Brf1 subunit/transcription initiation factor TFIIB